jgi:hypothetical protein
MKYINRPGTLAVFFTMIDSQFLTRNRILTLLCLSFLLLGLHSSPGQGTLFTYQGVLANNGSAVNGTNAMKFSLWTAANAGSPVGTPITNSAVAVTSGSFTVGLDFGAGIFTGPDRWLEIGVGTNNSFTLLAPRQKITPTPYALMANSASNLLGALPAGQLTGNIADAQLSTNVARLHSNQTFTAANTFSNVTISGLYSLSSTTVSPSEGSTLNPSRSFLRLNPSGPVTLSLSTAIASGSTVGTILILQGMNNINTVTINDGANVQLALLSRTLGIDDTLTLIWNGTDWIEVAFANN